MEYKAPTNHHVLLLLLLLLLIFAYIPPITMEKSVNVGIERQNSGVNADDIFGNQSPTRGSAPNEEYQTEKVVHAEVHSGQHAQSCMVLEEPQCRRCPSAFEPETYKDQNDLGPFIHQRLMELSFEVVRTIDMLKLLKESNSEFNDVHDGAKRLRDASHKLLGKKLEPQYACLVK